MGIIEEQLPREKNPAKYDELQDRWTQIEKILETEEIKSVLVCHLKMYL